MPEFIRARHAGVEGEALLPTTAFRHMPGWEPVEEGVHVPSLADGTVTQVLDAVGDDPVRAAAALEAERAGKRRTTLVERLSEIANQDQE
jgi:hypothetical protein